MNYNNLKQKEDGKKNRNQYDNKYIFLLELLLFEDNNNNTDDGE